MDRFLLLEFKGRRLITVVLFMLFLVIAVNGPAVTRCSKWPQACAYRRSGTRHRRGAALDGVEGNAGSSLRRDATAASSPRNAT